MTPNPGFKVTVYLQVEYLKKRYVLGSKLLKNTNRKPYTIYLMVPLSMTFDPDFKVTAFLKGQALNPARPVPARPTSLKTVPARPKIRPGQEDVKSRRRLIKGDRRRLLRNYVSVRRCREHALSNPATKVNDRGVDWLGVLTP